eukprot:10314245-Ditylum_brightwellii.AAC.1
MAPRLQDFMEETISNNILVWLHELNKLYGMMVLKFVNHFDDLNSLVKYCPDIGSVNPKELANLEKMTILLKVCCKD